MSDLPDAPTGGLMFMDLSATTGLAYGVPGKRPIVGNAFAYPDPGEDGAVFAAHADLMAEAMEKYRPTRVACEAALPFNTKSNAKVWECQIGLLGVSRLIAYRHGVVCKAFLPQSIRSKVLGFTTGNASGDIKFRIAQWLKMMGYRGIVNDDHADAIVGWLYCEALYYPKLYSPKST